MRGIVVRDNLRFNSAVQPGSLKELPISRAGAAIGKAAASDFFNRYKRGEKPASLLSHLGYSVKKESGLLAGDSKELGNIKIFQINGKNNTNIFQNPDGQDVIVCIPEKMSSSFTPKGRRAREQLAGALETAIITVFKE
ncbi:Uncharacterised protein [uncultured archaeon]|nr:Uncharacterised protein [uncultured archaeon]